MEKVRRMRPHTHWMFALFAALAVTAGWPAAADAGHPSQPKWSAEQPSGAVAGCLSFEVLEGREGLIEIKNMCPDNWSIESGTCDPAICEFETIEIPAGASKRIGPRSFGIDANELRDTDSESVEVSFKPMLGDKENPEMTLTFNLDGWTDASHDMADATSDTGDTGGDVAGEPDVGSDASEGDDTRDSDTESGGCSATGGSAPTPLLLPALLLFVGLRVRRS